MTKEQLVDELLNYFINEDKYLQKYEIPSNYTEKRLFLRGIVNLRPPKPLSEDILKLEDKLLQLELKDKKITNINEIKPQEQNICLWQGDITTLKIDAIVNAANSAMLGCFIPNHHCIDNAIHTFAGIRLRLECQAIMQGKKLETGKAKITKAYNLPSNYVIHTVGPIIQDKLMAQAINDLKNCYVNCLELARKNNIKTIAFPAISTGIFHFPKEKASEIAVTTVKNYFQKYPNAFDKAVFNVFTKEDYDYYDRLLKN